MSPSPHSPAGEAPDCHAVPGFLLHALTLLLDPSGPLREAVEISMQSGGGDDPAGGQEQFGLGWTTADGRRHERRIRSTRSMFLNSKVTAWAESLAALSPDQTGGLVLVGMVHPRLEKLNETGGVSLTKVPYDPETLAEDAAAALAAFRSHHGLPGAASPVDSLRDALCLAEKLGVFCGAGKRTFTRPEFDDLWRDASRQATGTAAGGTG